jgi:hypothetical protein
MKEIVLRVEDEKLEALLNFLKTVDYIQIEKDAIPEWQKNEVHERLAEYKRNPSSALDFDATIDEIEQSL